MNEPLTPDGRCNVCGTPIAAAHAGEPQAGEARQFPIMEQGTFSAFSIPWSMIESHNEQALKNHSQSLETLASRGGLSPTEALCVLDNRPFAAMDLDMAVRHLRERVLNLGPQSNRQHAGEGKAFQNIADMCRDVEQGNWPAEAAIKEIFKVAAERAPLVGREREPQPDLSDQIAMGMEKGRKLAEEAKKIRHGGGTLT